MAKVKTNYKVGEIITLYRPFKIFRILPEGYDACDDEGNCLIVSHAEVIKSYCNTNQKENMKAMKDAVLSTAKTLAKANNTVTTLEIKTELRRDFPYYFWTQDIVSKYMDQLAGDGLFAYTDNGTYRIYRLVNTKSATIPSKAMAGATGVFGYGTPGPSITTLFGKISGTIATKTSKPVTRTKSTRTGTVKRDVTNIKNLLTKGTFGFATFNGKGTANVTSYDIKAQKKSVHAYITRRLGNLSTINVAGKTYKVA